MMIQLLIALFILILSLLPFIDSRHWIVKVPLYLSLQLLALALLLLLFNLFYFPAINEIATVFYLISITIFLRRILGFALDFRKNVPSAIAFGLDNTPLSMLIFNVYQENTKYIETIDMLKEADADVIVLLEVEDTWKSQLDHLKYNYNISVPLSNTYGMILLSKHEIIENEVKYRVQSDVPSISCIIRIGKKKLNLFCIHPRPPVPPESETSRPKEKELESLAKDVVNCTGQNILVAGDLNDVPWSDSSKKFKAATKLNDPRIGRGIFGTFPSYFPIKIPLDHIYCSDTFKVEKISILQSSGSDHHPLLVKFQF